MESRADRRIQCICRHLSQPSHSTPLIHALAAKASPFKLREAVIIGGMVLDIQALPSSSTAPRTTTPGKVQYVLGGVARNIGECMSKLGGMPFMISSVGLDMAGNFLWEHWKSAGLPVEGIRKSQDTTTAVVCHMLDSNGEVAAGVASFESIEKSLTAEWIQQFRYRISSAQIVLVDANLSHPALETACRLAVEDNVPLWFEPVSVAKSRRIASVAEYINFASPNEDELIAMANALSPEKLISLGERYKERKSNSPESLFEVLKPAVLVLLEKGIKVLVVTLGAHGVFVCAKGGSMLTKIGAQKSQPLGVGSQLYNMIASTCPSHMFHVTGHNNERSCLFTLHLPAIPASVKKLTGAGDCLVGASLAAICEGLTIVQAISIGIAVAKATVEADTNVPSTFDLFRVADDARAVYFAAKVVHNRPT